MWECEWLGVWLGGWASVVETKSILIMSYTEYTIRKWLCNDVVLNKYND